MPDSAPDNEPDIDPRLLRLRVELFTALQMLKGEQLKYFEQLISDVSQCITPGEQGEQIATKPSYGSLLVGVRMELLEKADRALKSGTYELACNLLNAYAQVK